MQGLWSTADVLWLIIMKLAYDAYLMQTNTSCLVQTDTVMPLPVRVGALISAQAPRRIADFVRFLQVTTWISK